MEILPVELPLHSTFVDDKVCVVAVGWLIDVEPEIVQPLSSVTVTV